MAERVSKEAKRSHKDKVDAFNEHLSSLSEHHDIPKVSLKSPFLITIPFCPFFLSFPSYLTFAKVHWETRGRTRTYGL